MIITVVGSFQGPEEKQQKRSTFDEACRAIGKALGERGHRLLVAHRFDKDGKPAASAESMALEGFRETMGRENFEEVLHHTGDPQLKAHTQAVERSDAVILIGGKEGTYAAGLSALLRRKMIITIPAFGGSARDLCEIDEINRTVMDSLRNLDTDSDDWVNALVQAITAEVDSYPRILIIHGRGNNGKALQERIANAGLVGLSDPVIMDLSGKGAVSVPEVFEQFASHVSATIAIVTADDIGGFARRESRPDDDQQGRPSQVATANPQQEVASALLPATELSLAPRARENVWVEVGWFWGRLGRQRIFLWLEDEVPLPSDLQGAAWSKGKLDEAWPQIQDFIINLRRGEGDVLPRRDIALAPPQLKAATPSRKPKGRKR